MALSRSEVQRVARLARLRLTEDELDRFADQLGRVVEYLDGIAELETAAVEDASGALDSLEAADEVESGLDLERFVANAPRTDGPYLVVPGMQSGEH